jgi:copper homeostasis protein
MRNIKLEVIALTVADAVNAQRGGASSLELVQNLALGGLTPTLDMVQAIRAAVTIPLRVIVRPHADNFVYSATDIAQIVKDVMALKQIGADGIVFGALHTDDTIDMALTTQIAHLCRPLEFTFHRAIDVCRDPDQALPPFGGLIQRLLTSGHATNVWDGRETIRDWVTRYGSQFTIACGGGVRFEQLAALVTAVGAPEYHVGTAAQTDGVVDADKVAQMVALIND